MHLEDERGQSCHAYAFLSRYDSYEEYQHERLKREEYRRDYEKREFERAEQRERQKQKAIVSQLTQTLAACVPLFFFESWLQPLRKEGTQSPARHVQRFMQTQGDLPQTHAHRSQ